jgi:hypothetical protein
MKASSISYYNREFAITNGVPTGLNYAAARRHLSPNHSARDFFGWLNVIPRVGGRWSYYGEESGPGGANEATPRTISYGRGSTFKVSRLWASATNGWLALDGLRHIIEPSVNYVYVPSPVSGRRITDRLCEPAALPIEFPDYNSIDSIDSQNVVGWASATACKPSAPVV